MPIAYAERKKRRQALLQSLVPELRQGLALRHVETVAKLPQEAQRSLAEALSAGLHNISKAITVLQEHPRASVEEVLRGVQAERHMESPASEVSPTGLLAEPDSDVLAELSDLLRACFPGMPRMTAEAIAADELLADALALVRAWQACLRSKSIQSELVFVVLCGLALHWLDELNQRMASQPHYQGALQQSGLYPRTNAYSHNYSVGSWPFTKQLTSPDQAPP